MCIRDRFLQGRQQDVIGRLSAAMDQAAEKLAFEQAAICRDQIQSLRQVQDKQYVDSGKGGDVDVVVAVEEGGMLCVNLAMVRGGRHLGDRPYFPVQIQDAAGLDLEDDDQLENRSGEPPQSAVVGLSGEEWGKPKVRSDESQILDAFVAQHYLSVPVPPSLVVSAPVDKRLLQVLTEQTGIKVNQVLLFVYAFSGLLAGLGGVMTTSRLYSANGVLGTGYELDAIAAVILGGTSFVGGVGTVVGTLFGALIISTLNNGLTLMNVSFFWQLVVKGLVIIIAVALDKYRHKGTGART